MLKMVPKKVSFNKSVIDDLMKSMLQELITISTGYSFPEKSFSMIVAQIVEEELSKEHPVQAYRDINRRLKYLGSSDYSPKELDATASLALLIFHGVEMGLCGNRVATLRSLLYSFRDDRNELAAHSTGNETEYEVFEWGVITLGHMSRFLEEVYSSDLFDEASRDGYRRMYKNRIKQAKGALALDYKAFLQEAHEDWELDALLRNVLDGDSPNLGYHEVANDFMRRDSPKHDFSKYIAWTKKAAEAGVDSAQNVLADWYYAGFSSAGIEKDWEKALELYEAIEERDPFVAARIASLYVNDVSTEHTRDEGMRLLDEYREKWNVETIEHDDGAIELILHSKKLTVKGCM